MKKIYFLTLLLPVILLSCDKVPEADFSIDTPEPEVGQPVYFSNNSKNADSFEWDFGDGTFSTDRNPSHIFTGSGFYTVELAAYNSGMEDKVAKEIEVFIPTLLEVDVFEWNEEWTYDWPISYISVWLYPTLDSWDLQQNVTAEGYTDADGVVVFSHLNEQRYYVDVYSEDYNNYTLREEDVGFIETDIIVPHKINWFIAWVDYVGTKGELSERRGGSYVIKRLDRKVIDTDAPERTGDWQVLYERSVKVE